MALFDSLFKPALDSVNALVNDFHLSPEDKLKAQQALQDAAAKAQQASLDYDAKLNDIAGQNIRADSSSNDKFTERARPSFLYVIIAVLAFNYIGIPLAQIFGSHTQPITLPTDLLSLFGVGFCGYSVSRTSEKISALPGDSQISILGMKVGNRS